MAAAAFRRAHRTLCLAIVAAATLTLGASGSPGDGQSPAARAAQPLLLPTTHAALPQDLDDYWLVPNARARAAAKGASHALVDAATAYAAGDYAAALTAASKAVAGHGPLTRYALYYRGRAQLALSKPDEAKQSFDALLDAGPDGYLAFAALIGKADALEAQGQPAEAETIYDGLAAGKSLTPDDVLLRLGRTALAAGDRRKAADALLHVYYEYPLSDSAAAAEPLLDSLKDVIVRTGYKSNLGRALMLFGARRYTDARDALQQVRDDTNGDDRELTDLRIAESDYYLKRYRAARDELQPFQGHAARLAEARFFYLSAVRELGDQDQYVALAHQLVQDFPDSTWAEEALNNLGSYYIIADQDDLAAQAFKRLLDLFPSGVHTERAAWKYGWWCYKTGAYAETARVFETTAAAFPHSDYRPSYLYWAGRAHQRLGERTAANARLQLVYTDYMNSYYGRLAQKQLAGRRAVDAESPSPDVAMPAAAHAVQAPASDLPMTAPLIRHLLAAGLDDDALNEIRYAQRMWGDSTPLQATVAWIAYDEGDLRRGITLMRRAYPQHLAAGGEDLPPEILQVIFPLTYWTAIRRTAQAHHLDPYIMAALINQESTFEADAHSAANAWGLMQIVPSTGRRLARRLGIRRYRNALLTNPDVNIRMGMLYFSQLVDQFGGIYYALASYNAGESRVVRWKAERPGLEEDEFIDDIPFPETQNYVKRILGTAEDYRRLYGDGDGKALTRPAVSPAVSRTPEATPHAASKKKPASKKRTTSKTKAAAKKKTTGKKKTTAKKHPGGG
ncbi:MAG TPA: transglycosylase SLT domain-containing protein [Vicinamibacterales bacterium]|nr:transglycosylase SLT domain-containing protein [Vicinamibacterales bacterium]